MKNLSFYYCQNKPFLFGKGLFLGGSVKRKVFSKLIISKKAITKAVIAFLYIIEKTYFKKRQAIFRSLK
ncbi:hypothetical protein [Bernardetia litoralis]|uniref:hypothetical protein n=1 Tax=Bernardetia litoralis TaxID=999 RepID=UPI00059CB0A4|nr:hypothetical protein [Bernardetia litoralis]